MPEQKIVIAGNSPAAAGIIEGIRLTDARSEITLLAIDGHLPYDERLFPSLFDDAGNVPRTHPFVRPKNFYDDHRVTVILDQVIERFHFKKNKITLASRETVDYDFLFLTDVPDHRFPEIKGTQKMGVYDAKRLKDVEEIVNALPLMETAAFVDQGSAQRPFVEALAKRGREVLVLMDNSAEPFPANSFVQWIPENPLVEILGDSDVKAVKLKSGKVMAAQMVIFAETLLDMRIFAETPLRCGQKIFVDAQLRTNIENVFAAGAVAASDGEILNDRNDPYAQGRRAGAAIGAGQRAATETQ